MDAGPEIKKDILIRSQVRDGGGIDDEGEGGAVSEMRGDLLNCNQMRNDGCVDNECVGGVLSKMVKCPL